MLKTLMAIVLVLAVLGTALPVLAGGDDVYVRGYIRRDGTYVQPRHSAPDGDRSNNWSTQGNFNPYTGQPGTKPLYDSGSGSSYGGFGTHGNSGGYGTEGGGLLAPSRRR
jgi:hypothetical protein